MRIGMTRWTKLGIGAAAVVLAIAAGTAAFAMRGDGEEPSRRPAAAQESDDGAGGASMAMCAQGVTDCVDVVVNADGGANCAADVGCDSFAGDSEGDAACAADACDAPMGPVDACPPEMACIEPWLMDPPVCPEGVPAEECRIDERCISQAPVEILPVPVETFDAEEAARRAEASAEAGSGASMECEPYDDPCSPEPDPNVRCLPPDCAVSSDGSISCRSEPPVCAVIDADGSTAPETVPCSAPGGCPGGDPSVEQCVAPEEVLDPSEGGGSDGAPGSAGAGQ